MKILLIDADSQKGFPNLALMKLSAYHKALGNQVDLLKGIPENAPLERYDKCYISCIYFQNKEHVLKYANSFPKSTIIEIGGSGIGVNFLPREIEHIKPDYSLYYDVTFSIGFSSRGCIRNCPWCIVPRKEGPIRDNAPITEFLREDTKKLILLDNNFLASPKWRENLQFIIDNDIHVNFNSGLDIRLINPINAKMLKKTMVMDWHFKKRKYTFAFDSIRYKDEVKKGFDILKKAGAPFLNSDNCVVYVLVGFNTTPQQDLERVRFLIDIGVWPYIMRYNKAEGPHRILLHLSRWVNRKYFQYVDFADYDYSDSKAAYEAVFEGQPDPSWGGVGCPQGGYAWANRDIDKETEEIVSIQKELGEYDNDE